MALLPVLLDMVDDMYQNLETSGRGHTFGEIPMLFVPQTSRCGAQSAKCGNRGSPRFCPRGQCRAKACGGCPMKPASDDFQVALDVKSYKPDEVAVKVKGREIIVEGKHEERPDELGFISRSFTRRYNLPEPYDPDTIVIYLSGDGKMTIKALKPKPAVDETQERIIPIERIPAEEKPVEVAEEEEKKAEEQDKPAEQ